MRKRVEAAVAAFDPSGTAVQLARSLLAFAQLTVLLANPDRTLFGTVPGQSPRQLCSGISRATLWCVAGPGTAPGDAARAVALLVLGAVVLGLWPRWTCVPHWYVAFSFVARTVVVDGGDQVAQIATLLLIPICLGDARRWQWARPERPLPPAWRGAAYAGHLLLRWQIAIVYFDAALSKLAHHSWRSGAAVPLLVRDPVFGLPAGARPFAEGLLGPAWAGDTVTWAVIAVELSIAVSVLCGARFRRAGLVLTVLLHAAIILAMGLFGFGVIMIAVVLAASGGGAAGGTGPGGGRTRWTTARSPGRSRGEGTTPVPPCATTPQKKGSTP